MRLGLDLLFLVPGETGGRETYARELIAAMLALEPSLDATAFVGREAEGWLAAEFGATIRTARLPVSARRPEQWAVGELALLPRAAGRAGVDVVHSLANFAPVTGAFRRVLTIHDLQYRALPDLLTPARRFGTAALLGLAVRRAHRIIAVSTFARDELIRELGVPVERVEIIPNGVGAAAGGPALPEAELRARHRLNQRSVALTVGTELPHKNLPALFDALALIPRERRPLLVLAGAHTDSGATRARARQAGIEDDLRALGFVTADTLEGLYRLAACVVLPSRYEGFGLPALEAMARGVPVACSDIPALRDVAGDAAITFSPARPAEIAQAIQRLVEDRALAERLREAGRERARRFSWTRAATETLRCYRDAAGPAGAGRR